MDRGARLKGRVYGFFYVFAERFWNFFFSNWNDYFKIIWIKRFHISCCFKILNGEIRCNFLQGFKWPKLFGLGELQLNEL